VTIGEAEMKDGVLTVKLGVEEPGLTDPQDIEVK